MPVVDAYEVFKVGKGHRGLLSNPLLKTVSSVITPCWGQVLELGLELGVQKKTSLAA